MSIEKGDKGCSTRRDMQEHICRRTVLYNTPQCSTQRHVCKHRSRVQRTVSTKDNYICTCHGQGTGACFTEVAHRTQPQPAETNAQHCQHHLQELPGAMGNSDHPRPKTNNHYSKVLIAWTPQQGSPNDLMTSRYQISDVNIIRQKTKDFAM